ncbi:hypothetical protein NQZ68_016199 [Dissostichus eleginoides]|nr:hypothetical protein NQZ68_016199 [Dissostichus eleginoides]
MADDLVQGRVATVSEWARDLRLAHPADMPPKTKDVPCTSLRVGEMHGRRKDYDRLLGIERSPMKSAKQYFWQE